MDFLLGWGSAERGVSGGDSRLALRITLRALQLLEVFLLPDVHDHLRDREQSRQKRLGHACSILSECIIEVYLEQAVAAELLAGIREMSEYLRKLPEEEAFAVRWHVAIARQGRDETLGVALAQLVDVCLVDRDGLLHRLVPTCRRYSRSCHPKRIILPQGLDDR